MSISPPCPSDVYLQALYMGDVLRLRVDSEELMNISCDGHENSEEVQDIAHAICLLEEQGCFDVSVASMDDVFPLSEEELGCLLEGSIERCIADVSLFFSLHTEQVEEEDLKETIACLEIEF